MTTTTLIAAQSFGTSTNIGDNKFSIAPVTLQATTDRYVISAKVTFGAQEKRQAAEVMIYFATCYETTTAANAPSQLGQAAIVMSVKPPVEGLVVKEDSGWQKPVGGFLNCWVSAPTLSVAATLTVTLTEFDDAVLPGTAGTPSTDVISVQGFGYRSTLTFTRTADTTAYTGGDVIGINNAGSAGSAIHQFTNIGPAGGYIIITGADLRIDLSSVPAGMTSFRLYLYDVSPTAILDNAAWDFGSGDRSLLLGYIDLGSPVDLGSTLFVQADGINKQFKLASASTTLYGELVTNGGYTPASGTQFEIRLRSIAV